MKTKKVISLIIAIVLMVAMAPSMAFADELLISPGPGTVAEKTDDIVILGTSDVHCAIDDNIGYAGLVAYKKAMEEQHNYVALVDAGDAIQGGVIGSLSKGEYVAEIMAQAGYDVLVPGNHEFDYGMDQFLNVITKKVGVPYVSANFVKDGKTVFDPYVIKTYGEKKVAFVGITTPETFFKSTPTYFQDASGNYIYGFNQGGEGQELYKAVQTAVDAAKAEGADYVIAIGHLGDDVASTPWTSQEVISNTTGIDAFMDGHAHSILTTVVKNKAGKNVPVVATGTGLEYIGKIVIDENGVITVANVSAAEAAAKDADVEKFVNGIKEKYEALAATVVAKTSVDLTINDENGNRIIRSQETNLGDLCADAYKNVLDADIAFVNGGGIRANIEAGDVTYGEIIIVHPFGNLACVVEATGQQILDALEFGAKNVGVGENGGFLHVAGLTYDINPFISPSIETTAEGEFVKVTGDYRVSNVLIAGEELDLDKVYTLASHNYMLKQGGDGFVMFKGNTVLKDEIMVDNQVLITYIQENLKGVVGSEYAKPQGRINILNADDVIADIVAKLEIAEYDCSLKAKSYKTYIKLTWNACEAEDVKYQVYRSTKSSSGYKKAITTSKTYYKAKKNIKSGTKYYFKVRAVKTIGGETYYGHWSNKVNGKLTK